MKQQKLADVDQVASDKDWPFRAIGSTDEITKASFLVCLTMMALIIGLVSQKGGVGKSTLARLLAREYAQAGWNAKIADLDVAQGTSFNWQARRLQNEISPVISVERFGAVDQALKVAAQYDLLLLDGPPHSSSGTLRIAQAADLAILPTGLSLDDLEPSILLAHELVKKGIPQRKIAFALCRAGDSETETEEARNYIRQAGYVVMKGEIPERTAYRRAADGGRTLTETGFPSLNTKADQLAQSIIDHISKGQKKGKSVVNGQSTQTKIEQRRSPAGDKNPGQPGKTGAREAGPA